MEHIVFVALVVSHVCCGMNLDDFWLTWKTEFNKNYSSEMEESYRRAVWQDNVKEMLKHNKHASAGRRSYTMGTNQLSDMTTEEIDSKLNGLKMEVFPYQVAKESFSLINDSPSPYTVNWTEQGLVSPVQNQGMCGSCWAFSAAGALEAQMKKKTGSLVPLSAQNLVDCSIKEGNHGCKGGFLTKAFIYIKQNNGIDSTTSYPYEAREGTCRYSPKGRAGYCSGFQVLPHFNETILMKAVAQLGPVSVGINAKLPSFHKYKNGIYADPLCDSRVVNHAVLLVGYGTKGGKDYWLIKNSWGTKWGEKGYFRLLRNKNMCGIANFAVIPTL